MKKAFTITELVIVIGVIAILAAVLIPSFANLVAVSSREAVEIVNNEQQIIRMDTDGNVLESTDGMRLIGAKVSKGIVYLIYDYESN